MDGMDKLKDFLSEQSIERRDAELCAELRKKLCEISLRESLTEGEVLVILSKFLAFELAISTPDKKGIEMTFAEEAAFLGKTVEIFALRIRIEVERRKNG